MGRLVAWVVGEVASDREAVAVVSVEEDGAPAAGAFPVDRAAAGAARVDELEVRVEDFDEGVELALDVRVLRRLRERRPRDEVRHGVREVVRLERLRRGRRKGLGLAFEEVGGAGDDVVEGVLEGVGAAGGARGAEDEEGTRRRGGLVRVVFLCHKLRAARVLVVLGRLEAGSSAPGTYETEGSRQGGIRRHWGSRSSSRPCTCGGPRRAGR